MEEDGKVQVEAPAVKIQEHSVREKVSLLKRFPTGIRKSTALLVVGSLVVVLAGVGTGWFLSGRSRGAESASTAEAGVPGVKESATEAGISDESTFQDSTEGVLEEGGIDGEGTHHLVREGGPSKYVYLTSTVIDLQGFTGKTVKVWGETIAARRAGWLMDVGKIKVLE